MNRITAAFYEEDPNETPTQMLNLEPINGAVTVYEQDQVLQDTHQSLVTISDSNKLQLEEARGKEAARHEKSVAAAGIKYDAAQEELDRQYKELSAGISQARHREIKDINGRHKTMEELHDLCEQAASVVDDAINDVDYNLKQIIANQHEADTKLQEARTKKLRVMSLIQMYDEELAGKCAEKQAAEDRIVVNEEAKQESFDRATEAERQMDDMMRRAAAQMDSAYAGESPHQIFENVAAIRKSAIKFGTERDVDSQNAQRIIAECETAITQIERQLLARHNNLEELEKFIADITTAAKDQPNKLSDLTKERQKQDAKMQYLLQAQQTWRKILKLETDEELMTVPAHLLEALFKAETITHRKQVDADVAEPLQIPGARYKELGSAAVSGPFSHRTEHSPTDIPQAVLGDKDGGKYVVLRPDVDKGFVGTKTTKSPIAEEAPVGIQFDPTQDIVFAPSETIAKLKNAVARIRKPVRDVDFASRGIHLEPLLRIAEHFAEQEKAQPGLIQEA